MSPAIEVKDLNRVYYSYKKSVGLWSSVKGLWNRQHVEKVALSDISLSIPSGEVIGLVGANGAGKTTLIKILSGLIAASSGEVNVLGYNPFHRRNEFLRKISVLLGQKNQLWWDIAPVDSYQLLMSIYDLDVNKSQKKIKELADILNCTHVLETQLRRLSLGERMKMELIGALLHDPQILFLDEPTIGLDIVAQTSIRNFLSAYVKDKKPTIILTSHYMDDISKLADRLLIISKGRLFYDGSIDKFTQKSVQKKRLKLIFENPTKNAIRISDDVLIMPGTKNLDLEVEPTKMAEIITQIAQFQSVQNISTEEIDFEETIREFLKTQQ
ncbi:MAG: ATP-binding cassette domain-containing protein [Bdellovibrionaceae bacterium]|nr:ATP-binding cassette domain-containing protein [Pseudobdellovibrionaceae bacterium]